MPKQTRWMIKREFERAENLLDNSMEHIARVGGEFAAVITESGKQLPTVEGIKPETVLDECEETYLTCCIIMASISRIKEMIAKKREAI